MVAESAKGRDGGGRDRDDGGGGPDSDVRSDPPDQLLDLVVQCAVQAQLAYHNEFKSEVRAKWLESFHAPTLTLCHTLCPSPVWLPRPDPMP